MALAADQADAYTKPGNIGAERNRLIEAEQLFRGALALEPASAAYQSNLGSALLNQVRLREAAELFRRAIETDPSFEDAQTALRDHMLAWQHYRSDLPPQAVFAAHPQWGR